MRPSCAPSPSPPPKTCQRTKHRAAGDSYPREVDNCQGSTPQAGTPFAPRTKRVLSLKGRAKGWLARWFYQLPRCGSPCLSSLERRLDIAPSPGEMLFSRPRRCWPFSGATSRYQRSPGPVRVGHGIDFRGAPPAGCEGWQARSKWSIPGIPPALNRSPCGRVLRAQAQSILSPNHTREAIGE